MPGDHNVSKEFAALLRAHDLKAWRKFENRLEEHAACLLKNCQVPQLFEELLIEYDREAWRVFVEDKKTRRMVRSIIYQVKHSYSQEDFDEIFQEAQMRAWASQSRPKSRYRGEARPRSWFNPIVHNAAIDRFKRKGVKQEVKFSELDHDSDLNHSDPIEKLLGSGKGSNQADKCLVSEVWDAVAGLPLKFRLLINLRYRYGYTDKKIAEELNIPEKTVNSDLKRGIDKLRKKFELYKWRGLLLGKLTNQQKHCCAKRGRSVGVVVKGVEANSIAARAGIKMNCVVVKIGLDPVCDLKELEKIVTRVKASSDAKITIVCCTERDEELEITIPGKTSNGNKAK